MAVEYKVIEKKLTLGPEKGVTKFYASANNTGELTLRALTKEIEKISTVSGADIRAVLYALVDSIPNHLANGKIIRLGDLGSFRINIGSRGEDTEKQVDAHSIKKSKIVFTPGKRFKEMQKTLTYKKV